MELKVLGISASPRIKGNSDLLLRQALSGAESAGAIVEYISLSNLKIASCTECNWCYDTGQCKIEDDYQMVSAKMLDADRLIFATPIFFMTVCSQAKALIDRCQCLWACKYMLKKPLVSSSQDRPAVSQTRRDRRAMVIAVGGSKSNKMFESVRLTMKSYFDILDLHYVSNLFVNRVNDAGDIEKHPTAMKEANRLGSELVTVDSLPLNKPIDVELT